jgi:hypothetical protein
MSCLKGDETVMKTNFQGWHSVSPGWDLWEDTWVLFLSLTFFCTLEEASSYNHFCNWDCGGVFIFQIQVMFYFSIINNYILKLANIKLQGNYLKTICLRSPLAITKLALLTRFPHRDGFLHVMVLVAYFYVSSLYWSLSMDSVRSSVIVEAGFF